MLNTNAIIREGMVLQCNSTVAIFGQTDCDYVEVDFCGGHYIADVENGKWFAKVQTGSPTKETFTMEIVSRKTADEDACDKVLINDILLGEVWLAGGQSNMELELANSQNGIEVSGNADYDFVRFYNVPKCAAVDDGLIEAENNSRWKKVKGQECTDMSAVAFYFAQKLYEELNIPIGIIDCYWGGTSATCWVNEESLHGIDEVSEYLDGWRKLCESKSDETFDKEMEEYNKDYNRWIECTQELRSKYPNMEWSAICEQAGPFPWPQPKGRKSPFRPFGLYESMISRIIPYTLKGIIYYQGEEDWERASFYKKLNQAVIKRWRKDFSLPGEYSQIPFYITQLPMYTEQGKDEDELWNELRHQQELCSIENENVGLAILEDCGEFDNIHPIDKKTPGTRLAYQALLKTYKCESGIDNIRVSSCDFDENKCTLVFTNTYGSLCYKKSDGKTLTALEEELNELENGYDYSDCIFGFEVRTSAGDFYKPNIEATNNGLRLIGRDGDTINEVRYGWFNYGVANVYNRRGIPLMQFWHNRIGGKSNG